MSGWTYFVRKVERGMISWPQKYGEDHLQSLEGGLNYLGSLGWELTVSIPKDALGTSVSQTLIFKKLAKA